MPDVISVGQGRTHDIGIALSRTHDAVNCAGCKAEWEEQIRDKRTLLKDADIDWSKFYPGVKMPPHEFILKTFDLVPGIDTCARCGCHRESGCHQPDGVFCPGCQGQHGGSTTCRCGDPAHDIPESESALCQFPTLAQYQLDMGALDGHPKAEIPTEVVPSEPNIDPKIAVSKVAISQALKLAIIEVCPNYPCDHRIICPECGQAAASHTPDGECQTDQPDHPAEHRLYQLPIHSREELEAGVRGALQQAHLDFAPLPDIPLDDFVGHNLV